MTKALASLLAWASALEKARKGQAFCMILTEWTCGFTGNNGSVTVQRCLTFRLLLVVGSDQYVAVTTVLVGNIGCDGRMGM